MPHNLDNRGFATRAIHAGQDPDPATGATIVLLPRFDAAAALELMQAEQVTFFAGVPTMYHALLNCEENARFEGTSRRDDGLKETPRTALARPQIVDSSRKLNGSPEQKDAPAAPAEQAGSL